MSSKISKEEGRHVTLISYITESPIQVYELLFRTHSIAKLGDLELKFHPSLKPSTSFKPDYLEDYSNYLLSSRTSWKKVYLEDTEINLERFPGLTLDKKITGTLKNIKKDLSELRVYNPALPKEVAYCLLRSNIYAAKNDSWSSGSEKEEPSGILKDLINLGEKFRKKWNFTSEDLREIEHSNPKLIHFGA